MTLGEKIKKARTAARMTVRELSKRSGVPMSNIFYYEKDLAEPSFFKISCIALVLHLSLDYLAGFKASNE